MGYTNSSLPMTIYLSPNHSGQRNHAIDTITIHHAVGKLSARRIAEVLHPASRKASCNYAIGINGDICLVVEEKNRSWCSANAANDNRAITFEVACDHSGPECYVPDDAYNSLIHLVADCCKRNGIKQLVWRDDKNNPGNMTLHKWFASTDCPGPWLHRHMGEIANEVNRILGTATQPADKKTLYRVQVGAYRVKKNAEIMEQRLKAAGYATYVPKIGDLYKVQTGAYAQKANAERQMNELKSKGFQAFITTN